MKTLFTALLVCIMVGCASPTHSYFDTHYGHYKSADGHTTIILSRSDDCAFIEKDGKIALYGSHAFRSDEHVILWFGNFGADYHWRRVTPEEQRLELVHTSGSSYEWPTLIVKK